MVSRAIIMRRNNLPSLYKREGFGSKGSFSFFSNSLPYHSTINIIQSKLDPVQRLSKDFYASVISEEIMSTKYSKLSFVLHYRTKLSFLFSSFTICS